MKKKLLLSLLIFSGFIVTHSSRAQSVNDNCSNASVITIPNSGFYLGNVISTTYNISADGVQTGETFAPAILGAGLFKKSMWYEFTLPTSRALAVTLLQPGSAIKPADVGFCIYKTSDCLPTNAEISSKLTPLAQFGTTFHPCVDSGVYLIQVSSNDSANGPLYIQLSLDDTEQVKYNFPITAYNFGVMNDTMECVTYTQDCLTIDNATDYCTIIPGYGDYNRSSWHTFTTGNYSDFAGVAVTITGNNPVIPSPYVGVKFYQGNCVKTSVDSLQLLLMDTLSNSNQFSTIVKKCGLLPNTTYSFELFFQEDNYNQIQVNVLVAGKHAANGPQPVLSALPASNKLGTLPMSTAGVITNFTDYFACNSRLSSSACGAVNPAGGVLYNGKKYDLSVWFTFSLSANATVNFYENPFTYGNRGGCDPRTFYNEMVRVFYQGMTNSCSSLDTSNLYSMFSFVGYDPPSSVNLICMPAGTYSVQIMGFDSNYYNIYDQRFPLEYGMFGQPANLSLTVISLPTESFDLSSAYHFDSINSFNPLKENITYTSIPDTFGCESTVLPSNPSCDTAYHKAIYREFTVQDSGVMSITNIPYTYPYGCCYQPADNNYQLFRGDANALTIAQKEHSYPQKFNGLTAVTTCEPNIFIGCNLETITSMEACVIPGTYTSVATSNSVGAAQYYVLSENPSYTIVRARTHHYSAATVQNMGSVIDSAALYGGTVSSDIDTFSCLDNAVFIGGVSPCPYDDYADTCTKAIYRQFYLSSAASISIQNYSTSGAGNSCDYTGYLSLFKGEASNGLTTLKTIGTSWDCSSTNLYGCLQAGWYTVVAYGKGPSYAKPTVNYYWGGGDIGFPNEFSITVTALPGPKYDRPYKAAVDSVTKAPFSIQWGARVGSTAAYPVTDTTYTLYPEHFNCTVDTPFSSHPVVPCRSGYNPAFDRVVYYVFDIVKPSFINIYAYQNIYYGGGYTAEVFPFDVRKDSSEMITATPVQPCVSTDNFLQICNIQPGVYTLVLFAGDADYGISVAPKIYVDGLGTSRFDFAKKAYDFGVIPADKQFHWGKVGDVNPLNAGRAPSNDFFYCTTGSAVSDPTDAACEVEYDPAIYLRTQNNYLFDSATSTNVVGLAARRNLWYTFVVDAPGSVNVKVVNKSPDKQYQYPFAVYSSPVDDTLPYSTIVARGLEDSTYALGLVAETDSATGGSNNLYYACDGYDSLIFTRNNCANLVPTRYYIVVDNINGAAVCAPPDCMAPNSQVEVGIKLDTFYTIHTKFDHYFEANNIGTNLGYGCYQGEQDNFTCATSDATDPNLNEPPGFQVDCFKTLWYKFSASTSGYLRRRISLNGQPVTPNSSNILLFQVLFPGDSTVIGLNYEPNYSYYTDSAGVLWESSCISPGAYYFILPGCDMVAQNVIPYMCIVPDHGDYCDDPVVATVPSPGNYTATATVDCHTIGTDYGEYGEYLSCPPGAITTHYKSTWFRIDVTGNDTMDVTVYLTNNTNAPNSDISYRLMTGDCGAMQEGSCVQDPLTRNTYRCLTAGSYFVQVFETVLVSPIGYATPVTGQIVINADAVIHADTCHPSKSCLATASFTASFDCNTSDSVIITNYSTYGTDIKYQWSLGNSKYTTSSVVPFYVYPHLDHDSTYNIKLVVTNTSCGGKDSLTVPILIPARPPHFYLPADTTFCLLTGTYTLSAHSFPGSTYKWSSGYTDSSININPYTNTSYSVTVTYATCSEIKSSTIDIAGMPTAPYLVTSPQVLCSGSSITLDAYSYYTSTYLWNNGTTSSELLVKEPGTYSVVLSNGVCPLVTDSVIVKSSTQYRPFGKDTSFCTGGTLTLNAYNPAITSYQWQNNTYSSQYQVTAAGIYWVRITFDGCTSTDSITVTATGGYAATVNAQICQGLTYMLPDGRVVSDSGTYTSSLATQGGCDSVITTVLKIKPGSAGEAGTITPAIDTICTGSTAQLIVTGSSGAIQWQSSANGISFTDIPGAVKDTFISPVITQPIYYRVVATGSCSIDSSAAAIVSIGSKKVAGKISVNRDSICLGGTAQLILTGSAGTIHWQSSNDGISFTDIPGASSSAYNSSGLNQTTYFRVETTGSCGIDSSAAIAIKVFPPPIAGTITVVYDTICPGALAILSLSGNSGTVQWQSSGMASGGFSIITGVTGNQYSGKLPQTTYFRIIASNGICTDTSKVSVQNVSPSPVASFIDSISGYKVYFNSDSSIDANTYYWSFGDNNSSTAANPMNTYDTLGVFHVCLTVDNRTNCTFTFCHNVTIFPLGIENITSEGYWSVYPNPFDDEIFLKKDNGDGTFENIEIYDLLGRTVFKSTPDELLSNSLNINVSNLSSGMYYLKITISGKEFIRKIIKQ